MFDVLHFGPHTCVALEGLSTLEIHLLLSLKKLKCIYIYIGTAEHKEWKTLEREGTVV